MPSPPTPDPGDTLDPRIREATAFASGRYTRRRVLGEGSQKVVYLVHDEVLDRDCALSMIKAELLEPDDLERFQREARAMARLDHPNIVAVYEVSEEAGRPFFVCQYISGGDLRKELRAAGGPLPVERALTIAADLCRALAHAHEHGIVHRDVKPANVLLTSDGAAKLGDLGLATAADRSRLTLAGSFLGTAAYMAPEQALGEPVDARSDLYSLGALLYEMVCGRPPFVDDNATAVIAQHINARPSAPSQHRRDLPPALDALILRLLAKSPDDRPQSAAAVGEELHRISESLREPASERTRFELPQRRRMNRRRRLLVAGAALAVIAGLAVAATLVFALRGHGQARNVVASLPLVPEGYEPVLEPRVCPPELQRDPDVRCQNLVVPEDRANPTGRQVRILVTVAPSTAEQAGVPLVNIGALSGTAGALDLRRYADVVGIGVRGTQFSEPTLTCPEVASVQRRILGLPANGPEANALFLDAAQQCGQRLAGEGVDLSAYGDNAIADDVRDLAIAMDWRQINVEGAAIFSAADQLSFLRTSHAAILIAAGYPGLVHAVVLGQPNPPQGRPSDINGYNAAFQAYYGACRADAACERAFPDLEQAVLASVAQYQQKPALIMTAEPAGGPDIGVLLDGDRNVLGTVSVLGHPGAMPFIASAIFQRERGLPILAAWLVQQTPLDPETPWGAYFSEYCEIDAQQPLPEARVEAAALQYPLFRVFAHDPYLKLCARWPTKLQAGAISRFEAAIQAPALIITGALDPISPPDYAQRAAKVFRDATVAVFPSLTDVFADKELEVGPPCIAALRLAFLRDPKAKLDIDGCIAQVPPVKFVGT